MKIINSQSIVSCTTNLVKESINPEQSSIQLKVAAVALALIALAATLVYYYCVWNRKVTPQKDEKGAQETQKGTEIKGAIQSETKPEAQPEVTANAGATVSSEVTSEVAKSDVVTEQKNDLAPNAIKVNIRGSFTALVEISADDTVESLKQKIHSASNIAVGRMRLFFNGKELTDDKTLKECGLGNRKVITLALRPEESTEEVVSKTEEVAQSEESTPKD